MKVKGIWFAIFLLIVATAIVIIDWTVNTVNEPIRQPPIELTISAAASLKDALAEIQKNYQVKNPNVKLLFNLGASGLLQKQIEQGAPADIFISAAPQQMNALEEKNLINKPSRKNLIENKLVVVVPTASTLKITKYEDLAQNVIQKIALGEPTIVPAGQYAQQVLQALGIWEQIKAKAVLAKDVRTVLTYTETGNVEAGIVYQSDAVSSRKVRVVAVAPIGSHQPIVYPIAVLSGAKQPRVAEEFLAYLFNEESKLIFEKNGFSVNK